MDIRMGIDIGQRRDFTAVAVVQRSIVTLEGQETEHFNVRHLERIPLRTKYTEVVRRIDGIITAIHDQQEERYHRISNLPYDPPSIQTFLDATGVGRPTGDALKAAGIPFTYVTFTGGSKSRETEDGEISLSKNLMIDRLIVLAQNHQIHVAPSPASDDFKAELKTYQRKVSDTGHVTYNALKAGTHDDLLTAVGLAVQELAPGLEPLDSDLAYALDSFTGLGWPE